MFRKSLIATAVAATITAATMGATATTANAGVSFYFGGPGLYTPVHGGFGYGHGYGYGGGYRYRGYSCRHWLNRYNWTGKRRYWRKYRRCLRRWY